MEEQASRILITGTGASGTQYTSKLLSKLLISHNKTLDVKHDNEIGEHGICSWAFAAQSDDVPWGPKYSLYDFKPILHQVRHPLKTISSARRLGKTSWEYIEKKIPEIEADDSVIVKSMKYWHFWNKKAQKIAQYTYKVEDFNEFSHNFINKFCHEINCPSLFSSELAIKRFIRVIEDLPRNIGHKNQSPTRAYSVSYIDTETGKISTKVSEPQSFSCHTDWLSWQDLKQENVNLTKKIQQQAIEYGYEL